MFGVYVQRRGFVVCCSGFRLEASLPKRFLNCNYSRLRGHTVQRTASSGVLIGIYTVTTRERKRRSTPGTGRPRLFLCSSYIPYLRATLPRSSSRSTSKRKARWGRCDTYLLAYSTCWLLVRWPWCAPFVSMRVHAMLCIEDVWVPRVAWMASSEDEGWDGCWSRGLPLGWSCASWSKTTSDMR